MEIQPKEAAKLFASLQAILVDIREPEERAITHIEGDVYIRMRELIEKVPNLDRNKKIILYCHTGGRSLFAAKMLSQKGFNTFSLAGGINNWANQINPEMPKY